MSECDRDRVRDTQSDRGSEREKEKEIIFWEVRFKLEHYM